MVTGVLGVDMAIVVKLVEEVMQRGREPVTLLHHNLEVVHVKVLHQTNEHATHKDAKVS